MKRRARSRLVFCLTFLFILIFFVLFKGQHTMLHGMVGALRRRQDDSTVWVLFKLVSYTELNSADRK